MGSACCSHAALPLTIDVSNGLLGRCDIEALACGEDCEACSPAVIAVHPAVGRGYDSKLLEKPNRRAQVQ